MKRRHAVLTLSLGFWASAALGVLAWGARGCIDIDTVYPELEPPGDACDDAGDCGDDAGGTTDP